MTDNMEPTGTTLDADTLAPRELRVVLVCDVVESVRWMERNVVIAFRGCGLLAALFAKIVVAIRTTTCSAPRQRS
jgi:hypothetical protein